MRYPSRLFMAMPAFHTNKALCVTSILTTGIISSINGGQHSHISIMLYALCCFIHIDFCYILTSVACHICTDSTAKRETTYLHMKEHLQQCLPSLPNIVVQVFYAAYKCQKKICTVKLKSADHLEIIISVLDVPLCSQMQESLLS